MNDRRRYRLVATTRTGSVRTVYRTRHGYSLRARKHYSAWMTAGRSKPPDGGPNTAATCATPTSSTRNDGPICGWRPGPVGRPTGTCCAG